MEKKVGSATISLAAGIIGLLTFPLFIVSLIAVVCGHKAIRMIKASENAFQGRWDANAGLFMGYLGIAGGCGFWIVVLFVSSLYQSWFTSAQAEARKAEAVVAAPAAFYLRLHDQTNSYQLGVPKVIYGKHDIGEDHWAVRIVGDECDLPAIYGMNFPVGGGPLRRPGQFTTFSPPMLQAYFQNLATNAAVKPWFRIAGITQQVVSGTLTITNVSSDYAWGRVLLSTDTGASLQGDFVLPRQQ